MSHLFDWMAQRVPSKHTSDDSDPPLVKTIASLHTAAGDTSSAEESDVLRNRYSDIPDLSYQITQYPPDMPAYVAPEARTVFTPDEQGKPAAGFLRPRKMAWFAPLRRPQDVRGLIWGSPWRETRDRWVIHSVDSVTHDTHYNLGRMPALLVRFHRAWGGSRIFELEVVLSRQLDREGVPVRGEVRGVTYETDPKVRKVRGEEDRKLEEEEVRQEVRFVCAVLMNVVVGFPMDDS